MRSPGKLVESMRLLHSVLIEFRVLAVGRSATGLLILLWAFWFWATADPAEDGWVAMPTREGCEAAREHLSHVANIDGAAGVSGCHQMTPTELERQRTDPPTDTPRFPFGF
jgi:hypothetical protein